MKPTKADYITLGVLTTPFILTLLMLIIRLCGVRIAYWVILLPLYPHLSLLILGILYLPILKLRIWRSKKKVK